MSIEDLIRKRDRAIALGKPHKIFDWDKAAKLIAELRPDIAYAGTFEDWSNTSDEIYREGKIVTDGSPHLASIWDVPCLLCDGSFIPCYITDHPTWHAETIWPESARNILNERLADVSRTADSGLSDQDYGKTAG